MIERRLSEVIHRVASDDVQRVARRVFRSVRPREAPPARTIALPDDVADDKELREYLRDTDIFGPAGHEAEDYLADSFERFRLTMALLPALPPGSRVLELGANPYFITRLLLRRGLDVTCANWFGEAAGFERKDRQEVTAPSSGERHVFEFDHFNVESERFPYEDQSFDVVLCCEILEHLPNDPTHLLAEIHRVTAQPGGRLILTTPNAVRYDNLVRVQRGENFYEELSGYGTYGRHNREYTVAELRSFLEDLGYVVHDVFAHDVHPAAFPRQTAPPDTDPTNRGDNLFAVAEPVGAERWRYPRWLYTSQHAIKRVVRPDVTMGVNDDLQARGFHTLESAGDREFRWSGPQAASVTLDVPGPVRPVDLTISGVAAPSRLGGDSVLVATVGTEAATFSIPANGEPFQTSAPVRLGGGEVTITLEASPTFVPAELGIGEDRRHLGLAITRVFVTEDAAEPA